MRSSLFGFAILFVAFTVLSPALTVAQSEDGNELLAVQAETTAEVSQSGSTENAAEADTSEEGTETLSASAEWVRAVFPIWLHDKHFLLADYQWICCFFLILLGIFADVCVRAALRWICRVVFKQLPLEELTKS